MKCPQCDKPMRAELARRSVAVWRCRCGETLDAIQYSDLDMAPPVQRAFASCRRALTMAEGLLCDDANPDGRPEQRAALRAIMAARTSMDACQGRGK